MALQQSGSRSSHSVNRISTFFIFLIIAVPFLFGGLAATSFLDPDEGMYGSIAREMAETGDWVTPRFNGVRYLNKPPLHFWLTSLTVIVFGHSEWVIRFWSALPALGAAALTWHMGNVLYRGHAGLLAALVLMSSAGVLRFVRVAATDFLLVFSITLAVYGFVRAVLSPLSFRRWSIVFWLGMALGVLSKGLIGVIFPLLIVGLFLIADRKRLALHGRSPWRYLILFANPLGLLVFFGLTLPWHILASWRNHGFFDFYFIENQFLRFLNLRDFVEDDIPVGTLSFLMLTLVGFFPWSCFLPAALRVGFPRLVATASLKERLRLVVGLWVLVVVGFFCLSSSKLEHYFLPAVPGLSLIVGAVWSKVINSPRSVVGKSERMNDELPGTIDARWFRWCFGIGAFGCAVVGVGLLLVDDLLTPQVLMAGFAELDVEYRILREQGVSFPFDVFPFVQGLKQLGVVLSVAFPLAFVLFQLRYAKSSFAVLVALAGIITVHVIKVDLLVEPYHSSNALAQTLRAKAEPNSRIVHEGPLEYSGALPLYTQRQVYILNGNSGSLDFGSRFQDARSIFLDDARFRSLWDSQEQIFLVTRLSLEQSSLRDIPAEAINIVGHYGSRWLYANRLH